MRAVSMPGRGRRRLVVSSAAVAAVLSAASAAWACTFSGGSQTYVGPTWGPPGSNIVASGAGATPGVKYQLRFADSVVLANTSNLCRLNGVILVNKLAGSSGYIPNTAAVIPLAAAQGNGQVCWAQKLNPNSALTPALWTVT